MQDKHALLDVTPSAVERLNYVQYYPIVVFCAPESRKALKALRQWLAPASRRSTRRLYAQAQKLWKHSDHLFTGKAGVGVPGEAVVLADSQPTPMPPPTATIHLHGTSDSWYQELKAIIREQQIRPIWTAEDQVPGQGLETLSGFRARSGVRGMAKAKI